jgi:hypothetical protein
MLAARRFELDPKNQHSSFSTYSINHFFKTKIKIMQIGKLITVLFTFLLAANQMVSAQNQVVWAKTVHMDAQQAESTSESKGIAILRVTADMKLTYKFIVQKIDDGDALTNAHIHYGAPGVNGTPFIFMAAGIENMGKNITIQLTETQYYELVNGTQPIYINVHSHIYPGDSIRGQIR